VDDNSIQLSEATKDPRVVAEVMMQVGLFETISQFSTLLLQKIP
jgi:hypothetical protein